MCYYKDWVSIHCIDCFSLRPSDMAEIGHLTEMFLVLERFGPQTTMTPICNDEALPNTMLFFALQPTEAPRDSSEFGTADLPSSVCTV